MGGCRLPGVDTALFRVPSGTAPGYRDAGYNRILGLLGSTGNNGFSWSSAVTKEISGLALSFHSQLFYSSHSDFRGHGLQLRCLSE
ncbi:hypothetical protein [uncultured Rikenella sp.]|uniref:hypothetical protein n=1 Tax=uncultured Rikenella sp. TaxID=368003 RepID=UPI00272CEED5|nr:hypothetical protein [uncultured Rikenella sp.]